MFADFHLFILLLMVRGVSLVREKLKIFHAPVVVFLPALMLYSFLSWKNVGMANRFFVWFFNVPIMGIFGVCQCRVEFDS